jgi:hypothetical protein
LGGSNKEDIEARDSNKEGVMYLSTPAAASVTFASLMISPFSASISIVVLFVYAGKK